MPDGQLWRSLLPTRRGDFLTHFTAVVRTRGSGGIIVQFFGQRRGETDIALGSVRNIHDENRVAQEMRKATGRGGWERFG